MAGVFGSSARIGRLLRAFGLLAEPAVEPAVSRLAFLLLSCPPEPHGSGPTIVILNSRIGPVNRPLCLLEISYSLKVKHSGDLMPDLLEGKIALFGQLWETFSWASSRRFTS